MPKIYLDNNASTFLDPDVREALIQELSEQDANPSSIHAFGQRVRNRVTKARRSIASHLNIRPSDIIFTSGGTEAMNMALFGAFNGGHIITSDVEHSCVYTICKKLEESGAEVTYLKAGLYGAVKPEQVEEAIRSDTQLITLMAVNNETGVKTDIEAIARLAELHRIPFIVDGVSLLGKEAFSISTGISAIAFSGHKIHAPKGIGFLVSQMKLPPLILGGGQEASRRGGTENVLGIIGLTKAVEKIPHSMNSVKELRDHLEQSLLKNIKGVMVNGEGPRIPNTTNLSFPGIDGDSLVMSLDMEGIAVSHGSACSSGALEPSRILLNMGVKMARTAIRFSLSRFTTKEEINRSIEVVTKLCGHC